MKIKLQARARRYDRSVEDEVRHILMNAATAKPEPTLLLVYLLNVRFANIGLDDDIPELRDHPARSACVTG